MWLGWKDGIRKGVDEGSGVGDGVDGRPDGFHGILLRGAGERRRDNYGETSSGGFNHEHWMSLTLPLVHFRVKAVRQGKKRAHIEAGNQPKLRRPLTWETVEVMEG